MGRGQGVEQGEPKQSLDVAARADDSKISSGVHMRPRRTP